MTTGDDQYHVMEPAQGRLLRCRRKNFMPYNTNFDPVRISRLFRPPNERTIPRVNAHHALPHRAMAANTNRRSELHLTTAPDDADISLQEIRNVSTNSRTPPRNLREARAGKEVHAWKLSYEKQRRTLEHFHTFEYIPLHKVPPGTIIHRAVISFTYKYNRRGEITGYKARFAFPGNRLQPGIDYNPEQLSVYTADRDTIRLLLAVVAQRKMRVYHIDLTSAFLHERYEGPPLYLWPTAGFNGSPTHSGKAARLVGNLYGHPEAARRFCDALKRHLASRGYEANPNDPNLYCKRSGQSTLLVAVTIDDFSAATDDYAVYKQLVRDLRIKYDARDLGPAAHMLGWTVHQDPSTYEIHIAQPHLAQSFINTMGMQNAAPADTPYVCGSDRGPAKAGEALLDITKYPIERAVGIARYLVDSTRPDIAVALGEIARHVRRPTQRHWKDLKQIARYLIRTKWHGLYYEPCKGSLSAQCDADFARCTQTRQSTYGFLIFFGTSLVSWRSRRIKTVVTSTFAAETIAASYTAEHLRWLRNILAAMLQRRTEPVPWLWITKARLHLHEALDRQKDPNTSMCVTNLYKQRQAKE